jgi:multidrug efflux pump subunit AcrA (membrane-fusion protein)
VQTAPFEKWTPLLGHLEAANPITLRADLDGLSKITWLIEDGTPVQAGDELARFDPSELEEKKLTLARDLDIAEAELRSLTQAQHPLEMQRLENEERSLQAEKREEASLLQETSELVEEMLLAEGELDRHQNKLQDLEAKITSAQEQIRLTKEILHPALEQKARARRTAAQTALDRIEERLRNTVVTAPVNGTVYIPPLHIDGDHRAARVGDGLFRNQVFMGLADLTALELKSQMGEQDLSRIVPGLNARVRFPAYPTQPLTATLSRVGTHPEGNPQRYSVTFVLDETLSTLRPGLTAEIEVLEYRQEEALLIPREFLSYENGDARVLRKNKSWQIVETGDGNAAYVTILQGIESGDLLLRP